MSGSRVHVATAATAFLPLIAEFWATSTVVDEPVADLGHANSGCLVPDQSLSSLSKSAEPYIGKNSFLFLTGVGVCNVLREALMSVPKLSWNAAKVPDRTMSS